MAKRMITRAVRSNRGSRSPTYKIKKQDRLGARMRRQARQIQLGERNLKGERVAGGKRVKKNPTPKVGTVKKKRYK